MERNELLQRLHRAQANIEAITKAMHKAKGTPLKHTEACETLVLAVEEAAHSIRYADGMFTLGGKDGK